MSRKRVSYGDVRLFKGEIITNDPEIGSISIFTAFYQNEPVIYINKWFPHNLSEVVRYLTHESLHIVLYYRVSKKISSNESLVSLMEYLTWCVS